MYLLYYTIAYNKIDFVTILFNVQELKTKVKTKNQNPVFNENFKFMVNFIILKELLFVQMEPKTN